MVEAGQEEEACQPHPEEVQCHLLQGAVQCLHHPETVLHSVVVLHLLRGAERHHRQADQVQARQDHRIPLPVVPLTEVPSVHLTEGQTQVLPIKTAPSMIVDKVGI
jgi:hypothetical protein